jgi:hypothetical protein
LPEYIIYIVTCLTCRILDSEELLEWLVKTRCL